MREFSNAGLLDDTLIILSSDNGIAFPSGRTNLYEPGMREPFFISHPYYSSHWGKVTLYIEILTPLTCMIEILTLAPLVCWVNYRVLITSICLW